MAKAPIKSSFHRSKYPFTLDVSPFQLDERYGFNFNKKKHRPVETTFIKDIFEEETACVSFFDASKKNKRWNVSLKDFVTQSELPLTCNIRCFHCHHTFTNSPLGCPIKYVPSVLVHHYYSPQSKDYVIQRYNLGYEEEKEYQAKLISKELDDKEYQIEHHNYFIVDKIVCSWNCMMAEIEEEIKNKNILYQESLTLIYDMYYYIMGKRVSKIDPAGPKTLLKEYGGKMDIEEYRNRFGLDMYTMVKNKFLRLVPLGDLFEKNSKF